MADSFLKGHAFEVKTMAREFLDIAMGTEKGPVDNAEMTEVRAERWGGGLRGMGWAVPATVLPLTQSRCRTPTPTPLTPTTLLDRPATMYLSIRMCMYA